MTTVRSRISARPPWVVAIAVALVTVSLDQLTKAWMVHALVDGPIDPPGPFWLHLVANRGVVLGIPAPPGIMFVAIIAIVALVVRSIREASPREAIAYGLLAGGALGNTLDRLLHRAGFPDGAVVDWIASTILPTFNLADAAMVAAIVLLFRPSEKTARAELDDRVESAARTQ